MCRLNNARAPFPRIISCLCTFLWQCYLRWFVSRRVNSLWVLSGLITNQLRTLQTSVSRRGLYCERAGGERWRNNKWRVYIINQLGPKPRKLQSTRGYLHARQCFGGAGEWSHAGGYRPAPRPPLEVCQKHAKFQQLILLFCQQIKKAHAKGLAVYLCNHAFSAQSSGRRANHMSHYALV